MSAAHRLLVIDDEPDLRTLYELTLVREGYEVSCAGSVEEAWEMLLRERYHLIISDMRLPDGNGLDVLHRLEKHGRAERVVVITAYGSAENAVEALKAGAYDYLTKPVDLRQFRAVVASALGRSVLPEVAAPKLVARSAERQREDARSAALQRMAGDSGAMQQVRMLIEKVARSMAPVLVHGESGTGKELVARAIHEVSARGAEPFVAVNCGAVPEQLLEAEFFGYRKGAFTGAQDDRAGFFQAAQGGTLFLDEIGELPLSMQSKLLRVIQERAVRPLGSVNEASVNVRIVSATHKDLAAEVLAGRFRQDLFYRLNVISVTVPPLRERAGDLPAIANAVLQRIANDAGVTPVPTLAPTALELLMHYSFPGNVRELENLLHRAVALSTGPTIVREDLALPEGAEGDSLFAELDAAAPVKIVGVGSGSAKTAGEADAALVDAAEAAAAPPSMGATPGLLVDELPDDLVNYLDAVERTVLERALQRHRFNRTAAGASLKLSLRQMRYRMARLGITVGDG